MKMSKGKEEIIAAQKFYERGFTYMLSNRKFDALADFNKAIGLNPENPEYYDARGNVYLELGNFEEAINNLNIAIGLNPKNPVYYYAYGNVYSELGNFEEAIVNMIIAIRLDPTNPLYYYACGIAYFKLDNFEEAINSLNIAIGLNRENPEYYNARGNGYRELGHFKEAIEDYSKAISLSPAESYYYNRGCAYLRQANYVKAIEDFSKAIELNPENLEVIAKRILVYKKAEEHQKVLRDSVAYIQINTEIDAGKAYDPTVNNGFVETSFIDAIKTSLNAQPKRKIELTDFFIAGFDFSEIDLARLNLKGCILIHVKLNLWPWQPYPEGAIFTVDQLIAITDQIVRQKAEPTSLMQPLNLRAAIEYCLDKNHGDKAKLTTLRDKLIEQYPYFAATRAEKYEREKWFENVTYPAAVKETLSGVNTTFGGGQGLIKIMLGYIGQAYSFSEIRSCYGPTLASTEQERRLVEKFEVRTETDLTDDTPPVVSRIAPQAPKPVSFRARIADEREHKRQHGQILIL